MDPHLCVSLNVDMGLLIALEYFIQGEIDVIQTSQEILALECQCACVFPHIHWAVHDSIFGISPRMISTSNFSITSL